MVNGCWIFSNVFSAHSPIILLFFFFDAIDYIGFSNVDSALHT